MIQCPYNQGDLINLKQQYRISSLLSETQTYWVFEAIQISNQREVMIKIYINERFSSIEEVEKAWKEEIDDLQTEAKYQGVPIEFIESDVKFDFGEKQFIIVFKQVEDIKDSSEAKFDGPLELKEEEPSYSQPSRLEFEKIAESRDKEISAPSSEIVLKKVDEFPEIDIDDETEEGIRSEEIIEDEVIRGLTPSKPVEIPPSSAPSIPKRKKTVCEEIEEQEKIAEKAEIEKDYLKHITLDYFDRMNPQNYYPMTISISDILEDISTPIVNPLTGERKVQKQTEMDVKLKDPVVTIRPIIPGCNVVPSEIKTDFNLEKDEVTFFITPGVKGEILGHIKFFNEGKIIHIYDFEAKVVDPNIARLVTAYGILASFIPKILTILGVDFGLEDLWTTEGILGSLSITGLIALAGILPAIIVGIGIRQKLKPKSCKTHFKLKDFRLKDIKTSKTKPSLG